MATINDIGGHVREEDKLMQMSDYTFLGKHWMEEEKNFYSVKIYAENCVCVY